MKKLLILLVFFTLLLLLFSGCPEPLNTASDNPVLSSEKDITSFAFLATDNAELFTDAIGTITGTDIEVTVPYGY